MIKPYLMFDRSCEEAFKLYEEAFGGEIIEFQKYGDMPPNPNFPVAEEDKSLVLHAQLKLAENGYIMGSDSQREQTSGDNFAISVELNSEEKALHAWNLLKEEGHVHMDLQATFFAKLHGSVKDKYGHTWMFTVM
ncbi:VOC family protein [Falsibacillus pallidus]|uniref:PhnB protein n=1 Tax=Falsibacillus pallidus TaxID=493781 RepID=A0A370G7C9_9BACI|nr:VOC family protein [Falsibacillus pallidus]RDI39110.1 PhnB protein [Falsibacillus pallidus]